jgi:aconitase A
MRSVTALATAAGRCVAASGDSTTKGNAIERAESASASVVALSRAYEARLHHQIHAVEFLEPPALGCMRIC